MEATGQRGPGIWPGTMTHCSIKKPRPLLIISRRMFDNPARSIEGMLKENAKEVDKGNLMILNSIIACVVFLGQQRMVSRGDNESPDNCRNRGHFLELLEFRATTEAILRKYLDGHLKNATYCSPEIQNELIFIYAAGSRSLIVDDISRQSSFIIIAYEGSDISNREQVVLVIRYVGKHGNIREKFRDYKHAERPTGVQLTQVIQSAFESYRMDQNDCRGQAYNGASKMSSSRVAVQGIISQPFPAL